MLNKTLVDSYYYLWKSMYFTSKIRFTVLLLWLVTISSAPAHAGAHAQAAESSSTDTAKSVAATEIAPKSAPNSVANSVASSGTANETAIDTDTEPGVIRFVFGSDSSTPGIHLYTKTANYANSNFDLFRSPTRQTARIMDPEFRNRFTDSSGEPFRFTWWMQGGSLYRYATNTNLPHTSLMSLYLMNKFHKENMERYGDEFTYHYHTWVWSDATGDGIYYWNQAYDYVDSRDDFFRNMAEALIEEDMFTVSFRSGWHFMDNDWQADLDDWIPFSMHNAWPVNRTSSPEPVNNIYVWDEAPSDWVPFRPRSDNYMLPGGDRGWNTRSVHFRGVRESHIREMFEAADQGIDQVPCIWSHVAENTFIEDLERVFGLIEMVAEEYPHIEYYYDTAIEAMQGWLQTDDTTPPVLAVDEVPEGDGHRIRVQSDKPLFMSRPFLAAKDIYENHRRVEMTEVGPLTWESDEILTHRNAVSWSVAATDSAGNLSKYHLDWLPRIVYIDDEGVGESGHGGGGYGFGAHGGGAGKHGTGKQSAGEHGKGGYSAGELGTGEFSVTGDWRVADYHEIDAVWGAQAHVSELSEVAASARWSTTIPESAHYDVQIRFPSGPELPDEVPYSVFLNGSEVRSGTMGSIVQDRWIYLHDLEIQAGDEIAVEIRRDGGGAASTLVADVVRITAYRPPVFLTRSDKNPDLGYLQRGKSGDFDIIFENRGYETAEITGAWSRGGDVTVRDNIPLTVRGRSHQTLDFQFHANGYGLLRDTLVVETSDPGNPVFVIPVEAYGKGPFQLVDNEDADSYEESGAWNYSVTQAHGSSSRWIGISEANKDAWARYFFTIDESARYALSFIVPGASNSALRAKYEVKVNDEVILERVIDQNADRSVWKWLGSFDAEAGDELAVTVSMADTDQAGRVLRADAMQIEQLGSDRQQVIIDNESDAYSETGTWHDSNAYAWGTSSRYTSSASASASYAIRNVGAGLSELEVLLPETENAVKIARYRAYRGERLLGEAIIDQNENSGSWAPVGVYQVDMSGDISIVVDYPGSGGMDGVLRTDAIRWTFSRAASETDAGEMTDMPEGVRLHQNYPNPFNPVTTIRFEVAVSDQHTRLEVYDVLGRRVAVLVDDMLSAGHHSVSFDGSALASGLYLYRLDAGGKVLQRKMMLVK